jgi:hypothetical protein
VQHADPLPLLEWIFNGDPKTGFGGVKREMEESEASVLGYLERNIVKHEQVQRAEEVLEPVDMMMACLFSMCVCVRVCLCG